MIIPRPSPRRTLSDKGLNALPVKAKRYNFPDPGQAGLYIRVMPTGRKSYAAVAVNSKTHKQVWHVLGSCDLMKVEVARAKAREVLPRIRAGLPPVEPEGQTFGVVAAKWLLRYVDEQQIMTKREIVRLLEKHLLPVWKDREFVSIRRGDVNDLLDEIAVANGLRTADVTLAVIRGIMNWHQSRTEDYTSPIVKGMKRQKKPQARSRILDDDEIRAVWEAADTSGTYGNIVKLLLLTGQRRDKVVTMRWADIRDGGWEIQEVHERAKGTAGFLVLPAVALSII